MTAGLEALNRMDEEAATAAFLQCCGARAWAASMAKSRPFDSFEVMAAEAELAFDRLSADDWMEAFAAHPRLGERKNAKQNDTANEWSSSEQSGVKSAADETKEKLAALNERYYERHGFTFILCASGRTAAEMVEALEARLPSAPEEERKVAAGEQRKITRLRLERLMHP